jgi:hypothetical protein
MSRIESNGSSTVESAAPPLPPTPPVVPPAPQPPRSDGLRHSTEALPVAADVSGTVHTEGIVDAPSVIDGDPSSGRGREADGGRAIPRLRVVEGERPCRDDRPPDRAPSVPVADPPADDLAAADRPEGPEPEPARATAPPTAATAVSILGPYTIDGQHVGQRTKPWKYSKTAELILYLLLHPAGASQDVLMEELFPEQPPNRPRLNQLVSDARTKALGRDQNGEFLLPHAAPNEPYYKLAPSIRFDLRDFARHCATARRATDDATRIQEWTAALDLVHGRPFTLPHDGYSWAWSEVEATVVKVEEAAVALADLAIAAGDAERAVWATRKGLLTGTGYYELLVRRGRAALLLEDPEEIVRAFAELQQALDYRGAPEEGMPDLHGHPELADVYHELADGGRGSARFR